MGSSVYSDYLSQVFDNLRAISGSTGSSHHSIVVVVSPLISLMMDQVAKLSARGLKATYIEGDQSQTKEVEAGAFQLVYISPESMISCPHWRDMFRSEIYRENLVCLAVDEAHLVEKWYD